MVKKILILAVLGVVAILYISPVFYLKPGMNQDTPDDVSRYLGTPSQSTDNPDGTTVSIYQVEKIPPLCVEYVVTFKNKLTGEDVSQQTVDVRRVLNQWTWHWCPSEKKAGK